MTFVKVDALPESYARGSRRASRKPLIKYLEAFMKMNIKIARVKLAPGEYACPEYARVPIQNAVTRSALPINVYFRQGDVYLVRRDI